MRPCRILLACGLTVLSAHLVSAGPHVGRVTDHDSGQPISGATVIVRRSLLKPSENRVLEETKHETDAEGKYQFTIPARQAAEHFLYIELDVEHPEYAPKTGYGYSFAMTLKNERLGEPPFFENFDLRRGQAVSGLVQTPDGRPLAGCKLLCSSNALVDPRHEYISRTQATTDADGHFSVMMTTPGAGTIRLLPDDFAPMIRAVNDERGDLGRFVVESGIRFEGRVVDAEGQPSADVWVDANGLVGRSALTDENGRFLTAPLPPGEYEVKPVENTSYRGVPREYWDRRPLRAVFSAATVVLEAGKVPAPVEIRAVPHVVIEAQYFNSQGKPTVGHDCYIFGRRDGENYQAMAHPDDDGRFTILAPRGLREAFLDLMTNEHGALRHRMSREAPLSDSLRVRLDTLNGDVKGIEIIRYAAPIVVVKVVASDGGVLDGLQVDAEYVHGRMDFGVLPKVHFEKQADGRFRSWQLFPDEEIRVTARTDRFDGYQPATETVQVPEGERRELVLTLESAPDAP